MKHTLAVLAALTVACSLVACDGGDSTSKAPDRFEKVDLGPLPEDVEALGDIYKDAFARAKEGLELDAARDRLREIEREILGEREEFE